MTDHNIKELGDAAASIVAVGTVMQFLPAIAAVLTIIWTVIRIYEWYRVRFGKEKPLKVEVEDFHPFKEDKKVEPESKG